jgi:hypothetical protein
LLIYASFGVPFSGDFESSQILEKQVSGSGILISSCMRVKSIRKKLHLINEKNNKKKKGREEREKEGYSRRT